MPAFLPALMWGATLVPQIPGLTRGASNSFGVVADAASKNGLRGIVNAYTSGDVGKAYYTGMMAGGGGLLAPSKGQTGQAGGTTKRWDPVNGYQLPKAGTGSTSRFAPGKYSATGAPIDPNTGQTRTYNIVDPGSKLEPDVNPAPTLAATSAEIELVDTEKAQRAAQAAAAYKAKQDEDARLAEIHKGYKTMREFGGEPVVTQEYMEQDAMREWAKANPQLAQKLIDKHGLSKDGIFGKESEGNMQYSPVTPLAPITPAPVMTADATFSPASNSIFNTASNINIENLGNVAGLNPQPVQSGFFKAGDAAVAAMPAISALSNTIDMDPEKYREVFSRLSQKN